jgi:hypothetical protein
MLIILDSSELSNYERDRIPVTTFERTFVFPKDITALTFTSTANGISVKDLVGKFITLLCPSFYLSSPSRNH